MAKDNTEKKDEKMCSVEGCDGAAHKSLSRKKVTDALTSSLKTDGRKVYLCKDHYKTYKKATKKERELERLGW